MLLVDMILVHGTVRIMIKVRVRVEFRVHVSFNIRISCWSICQGHGTVNYIYNDVNRHWITTSMNNFEHLKIYIIVNFYCYANVVKLGKVLIFRCLSMFF